MRKPLWVIFGVGILLTLAWLLQEPGEMRSGAEVAVEEGVTVEAASSTAQGLAGEPLEIGTVAREQADVLDPEELAAGVSPTEGDLHLLVVHHSDRAPVPGAFVELHLWDQPNYYSSSRTLQVGDDGRLELPAIGTGRFLVSLVRSDEGDAYVRGELHPGKVTEVELVLGQGVAVFGVVHGPDGKPVPDAEIWISNGVGSQVGAIVGRSDLAGRYRVEDVGSGHGVGARKVGFSPSVVPMVIASPGAEVGVDLYLTGRGGAAAGRVLDDVGGPVADAQVLVGPIDPEWSRMPNGEHGYAMPAERTYTDADGRFAVDGLAPGEVPLIVRAAGWALHEGTIEIFADETARDVIRLTRGVTAHGHVFDAAGEPVARARVDNAAFGVLGFQARADSQGHYRIRDLPTGGFRLRATAADGEGIQVEEEFRAGPGATVEWNPVLAGGLDLRLRIVDEDGEGREGMFVELQGFGDPQKGQQHHFAWESTDAHGRLVFPGCPDLDYTVEVRAKGGGVFAAVRLPGVRAGGEEVVIVVPTTTDASITIAGRVLMADGTPAGGANVVPSSGSGGAPILPVDPETGEFEVGPFPPGEFTVRAEVPGFPARTAGPRRLESDERWEVGDLVIHPGGTVRGFADRSRVAPDAEPRARLLRDGAVTSPMPSWEDGVLTAAPVAPGEYRLWWDGDGVALGSVPVVVRAEEETLVQLRFEPGIACALTVTTAEEDDALRWLRYTVASAEGDEFHGRLWRREGTDFTRAIHLAPGRWRFTAWAEDGRRVEGAFEVSAVGESAGVSVELPAADAD